MTVAATTSADTFVVNTSDAGFGVTGFTTTADKIDISTNSLGTTSSITVNTAPENSKFYVLTGQSAGAADAATDAKAALATAFGTFDALAAATTVYGLIVDDDSSAVFKYTGAANATGVEDDTVTLLGTIDAVMTDSMLV